MRAPTHYGESLSGPRERIHPPDCAVCRGTAQLNCPECGDPVCQECMVECFHCRDQEGMCIACGVKRGTLQKVDGDWACENCLGAMESELEAARR